MDFFLVLLCVSSHGLIRTPVIRFRAYSNPIWTSFNLRSAKILFPNMVTFRGCGCTWIFGGTLLNPVHHLNSVSQTPLIYGHLLKGKTLFQIPTVDSHYFYFIGFILVFFFGLVHYMWKCPSQGSNPCHSSDLSHSSDSARSLTARPPGNSLNYFCKYIQA